MENINENWKIPELKKSGKTAFFNVLFSSLGPFGAAIQESLFGIGDRIRNDRVENYLKELEPRLKEIENLVIPKEYYKSIEFYDLNYKILKSASETSEKLKYKILSNIYIESINPKTKWENDLKNIFIKIILEIFNKFMCALYRFPFTRRGASPILLYRLVILVFKVWNLVLR